ncbi:MAG: zf-HC2 domain-containing protein [Vicinamibacterales bacterium]
MSDDGKCRVLAERLSASLDGDLDAAECRRLQRHARDCPRCARIVRELERTTGLCRRAAEAPLPAPIRRLALARVRALMQAEAGRRPPATRRSGATRRSRRTD